MLIVVKNLFRNSNSRNMHLALKALVRDSLMHNFRNMRLKYHPWQGYSDLSLSEEAWCSGIRKGILIVFPQFLKKRRKRTENLCKFYFDDEWWMISTGLSWEFCIKKLVNRKDSISSVTEPRTPNLSILALHLKNQQLLILNLYL